MIWWRTSIRPRRLPLRSRSSPMRRCIFIALMLALGACSKDKDPDSPAKLTDLQASLRVEHLWSADVGGDKVPLRLGLALASDGERVFAAGRKGDVAAFASQQGISCGTREPRQHSVARPPSVRARGRWFKRRRCHRA